MKNAKYIFGPYKTHSITEVRRTDLLDKNNFCLIYSTILDGQFIYRGAVYTSGGCMYIKDVEKSREQLEKLKHHMDEYLINIGGIILTEDQLNKYKLLE